MQDAILPRATLATITGRVAPKNADDTRVERAIE